MHSPATVPASHPIVAHVRVGERRALRIAGRLIWRDSNGTARQVSVMTRDASEHDLYVECLFPATIPLYRLVHFTVDKDARTVTDLPRPLRQGKVLGAIYRVGPSGADTGTPGGYALRLLVAPPASAAGPDVDARAAAR